MGLNLFSRTSINVFSSGIRVLLNLLILYKLTQNTAVAELGQFYYWVSIFLITKPMWDLGRIPIYFNILSKDKCVIDGNFTKTNLIILLAPLLLFFLIYKIIIFWNFSNYQDYIFYAFLLVYVKDYLTHISSLYLEAIRASKIFHSLIIFTCIMFIIYLLLLPASEIKLMQVIKIHILMFTCISIFGLCNFVWHFGVEKFASFHEFNLTINFTNSGQRWIISSAAWDILYGISERSIVLYGFGPEIFLYLTIPLQIYGAISIVVSAANRVIWADLSSGNDRDILRIITGFLNYFPVIFCILLSLFYIINYYATEYLFADKLPDLYAVMTIFFIHYIISPINQVLSSFLMAKSAFKEIFVLNLILGAGVLLFYSLSIVGLVHFLSESETVALRYALFAVFGLILSLRLVRKSGTVIHLNRNAVLASTIVVFGYWIFVL